MYVLQRSWVSSTCLFWGGLEGEDPLYLRCQSEQVRGGL